MGVGNHTELVIVHVFYEEVDEIFYLDISLWLASNVKNLSS
jgi:hypothetical protein